ncbi:hypothetical protein LRS05_09030 [Flavobacterium sp. J372]|uniref:hypothetical protein n=1 Tax=Flavobacterium sp. J372 TaxID=2898436 RepID=UPI002150EC2A|nr:hypothetical protein [Flavobacterium sp. J372]MCR5862279.1 hypothetical protein [Flavobacterium sp. J372]
MKVIITCFITLFSLASFAQAKYESKAHGFSMNEPEGWIVANNQDVLENLEKLDLDDAKVMKILEDRKGSLHLVSFYKYDPQTHPGLIPAIQINLRERRNKDWDTFKSTLVKSARDMGKLLEDYEFMEEPADVKIDGIKCIYFRTKFTMKTDNGQQYRVRNRMYIIPKKDYYFQINFTDGLINEDCSAEFDKLVKSIDVKR